MLLLFKTCASQLQTDLGGRQVPALPSALSQFCSSLCTPQFIYLFLLFSHQSARSSTLPITRWHRSGTWKDMKERRNQRKHTYYLQFRLLRDIFSFKIHALWGCGIIYLYPGFTFKALPATSACWLCMYCHKSSRKRHYFFLL